MNISGNIEIRVRLDSTKQFIHDSAIIIEIVWRASVNDPFSANVEWFGIGFFDRAPRSGRMRYDRLPAYARRALREGLGQTRRLAPVRGR